LEEDERETACCIPSLAHTFTVKCFIFIGPLSEVYVGVLELHSADARMNGLRSGREYESVSHRTTKTSASKPTSYKDLDHKSHMGLSQMMSATIFTHFQSIALP